MSDDTFYIQIMFEEEQALVVHKLTINGERCKMPFCIDYSVIHSSTSDVMKIFSNLPDFDYIRAMRGNKFADRILENVRRIVEYVKQNHEKLRGVAVRGSFSENEYVVPEKCVHVPIEA